MPGDERPYGRMAGVYDRLMGDVDYEAWAAYYHQLMLLHGCQAERVVDCACGTGSMTAALALRGFNMTGVDISEEMLALASDKMRALGIQAPMVCQDMRALDLPRPVDAIVCACDGVNYLTSVEETRAFFGAAHRGLIPGGLLLFDISSRYKLELVLDDNVYGEDHFDLCFLWQNAYDPRARLIEMTLTFFTRCEGGLYQRFDERHVQRAHEPEELCQWLAVTGFEVLGIYGETSLDEPKPDAQRLHMVARRAPD